MKLQINKKVNGPKSAIFAVVDSINFYVAPSSLKDINVLKLADKIVVDTRREFGEEFTKPNLEEILNKTIQNMTTVTKSNIAAKPSSNPAAKDVTLSSEDMKVVNSTDSLNKRIAKLNHLWNSPSTLAKAFGKSRQRVINAIRLAKKGSK